MVVSILTTLLLAMVVTAALTPLVRSLALRVGAVDEPGARRVNSLRTPRLGGIAIVAGFVTALLALYAMDTTLGRMFFAHARLTAGLLAGGFIVALLGVVDDVAGVGAKHKLLIQCIAALVAFAAGLRIEAVTLPVLGHVDLGLLALPATVLWITGIINALNLIDGLDGLAAGVAFFACLTNFVTSYLGAPTVPGSMEVCLLAATLAGAIVGFLFHNFHPATIFMGDSGSMFLGFLLAVVPLFGPGTHKGGTAVAILVPILALGLPITDMLLAMVRRFLDRRSIFAADRGHIHHRLLDLGLTHRRAVLILYGTCTAFTVGALMIYIGRSLEIGIALLAISLVLVGVVRSVGHFSFQFARREAGNLRREPSLEALRRSIPNVIVRMDTARGPEDLPTVLERFAGEAGLLSIELAPVAGSRLPTWRWTVANASDQQLTESLVARFPVLDTDASAGEVRFRWSSALGEMSPQTEILLLLVADAAERLMQRQQRGRDTARTGRLSIV